jgi:hypothetical protein
MPLNTTAKNALLDGSSIDDLINYLSLHDDDPSTTGANEVSGGSPAYARKAATWDSASSGAVALSSAVTFDVPASTTVKYVGYWSASTEGTFYGSKAVTNEAFAAQGEYELTAGSISLSDPA